VAARGEEVEEALSDVVTCHVLIVTVARALVQMPEPHASPQWATTKRSRPSAPDYEQHNHDD
jgi:hypothetical protein